jgi:hypothetical protein
MAFRCVLGSASFAEGGKRAPLWPPNITFTLAMLLVMLLSSDVAKETCRRAWQGEGIGFVALRDDLIGRA